MNVHGILGALVQKGDDGLPGGERPSKTGWEAFISSTDDRTIDFDFH
jgi:hypothetical protein